MANVNGSRAPADMIQKAVEQYVARVFAAGEDTLPDAPLSELDDAALMLAKMFSGDLPALRQAVGQEFIERLSQRWRGTSNDTRHARVLRHVIAQINNSFPTVH